MKDELKKIQQLLYDTKQMAYDIEKKASDSKEKSSDNAGDLMVMVAEIGTDLFYAVKNGADAKDGVADDAAAKLLKALDGSIKEIKKKLKI